MKPVVKVNCLITTLCVAEIPMPSSPPKATEVRSSGTSKEGECDRSIIA